MKKLTLSLLCVGLLAAVMVAAPLVFFVSKLPAQNGQEKMAGLSASTKIIRDSHGVPHIFASTLNDGFTALGYLHASDRMFQMEMMRRAGSGRLAEILGSDLINYDKKMRALGFYKLIEPYYNGLSPDTKNALDAYATGVNAYMAKGNFPAEFTLLGFKPTQWQPWDGLIWAKMMAWQLSGNFEDEVYREALLKNGFSKAQIGAMYPAMDHDVPSTMKPLEWVKKRHEAQGIGHEGVLFPAISSNSIPMANSLWPNIFDHLPHTASNAYVIAGAHTKSGKPILANDPHLQLQSPILWYLARIVTPQGELKGATAAGLPFFPLGQNSHVAWGFTTSNIDVEDVTFISNDTKNFTTRHEIIHVKDGGDVTMDVAENNQGVILSDAMASVHDITPPHKKALLQFTGFDANDRTVEALFHINTAMNAAGIETALKDYSVPPQNLLYADDAGHTGYVAVGVIPKRSNDGFYASDNKMWQGVMAQTSDTAPRLKDPKAGVILTANQAIVDDKACAAFSCSFARDWAEPYRAMRMEEWFAEQFENKTMMDVTSASGAMLDMTSDAAKHFLPTLLQGANAKGGMQKDILAAISRWDGSMARDKPEPLIYHAWLDAIMRAQFGGQYTSDVLWPRMWALEHQAIRADVIQTAFNDALAGLQTKYGAAWQQWRWGSEHIAPLKHPLWSHVPVLNQLTSLATETDGDGYTLRRGAPLDYSKPFLAEHGAGYRGVYDVGNPAQSLFMIAGGESGQLLSPHYGNLRSEWSDGKFFTLTGDEAALMQNNASVLTLTP